MGIIKSNIRYLRKQKGLTQEGLANAINVTRSVIGAYEEGRAEPKIKTMESMANFFGITLDQLITQDLAEVAGAHIRERERGVQSPDYAGRKLRVLSITVDANEKENIELVPEKAAAGYQAGFSDPEYLEELPRFQLPMLPPGTYRAFEITGDSMLPITPGTIIIGEYVDNWETLKDGSCYIVVSEQDGIVYKRVFNHIQSKGQLALHSDNTLYAPYSIGINDVIEIWRAKAYVSMNFPDGEMNLQKLAGIVMDLQQEVIKIKGNE